MPIDLLTHQQESLALYITSAIVNLWTKGMQCETDEETDAYLEAAHSAIQVQRLVGAHSGMMFQQLANALKSQRGSELFTLSSSNDLLNRALVPNWYLEIKTEHLQPLLEVLKGARDLVLAELEAASSSDDDDDDQAGDDQAKFEGEDV